MEGRIVKNIYLVKLAGRVIDVELRQDKRGDR